MADIIVTKNNNISYITIKDKMASGYTVTKDGIISLDAKIVDVINKILPSNNLEQIKNNSSYEVYLDNNSKLLHFYKDGNYDIAKFIKYNTSLAINYYKKYNNKKLTKKDKIILRIEEYLIVVTLGFLIFYLHKNHMVNINKENALYIESEAKLSESTIHVLKEKPAGVYDPITADRIHELLISNQNLTEEEIAYLDNQQFINDLMPYIDETSFKYVLEGRLKDLSIENYTEEKMTALGYYGQGTNKISIKNYNTMTSMEDYKDTLAHEYCHLLQCFYGENYVIEAVAEIMSNEYFEGTRINAYPNSVDNIKILMETIGPKPVIEATLNNSYDTIYDALKKYLSNKQLNTLINDFDNQEILFDDNDYHHEEIKSIILEAYKNKYGENLPIELLSSIKNDRYKRYYFNTEKRDNKEENTARVIDSEVISLDDAVKNNIVEFYSTEKQELSYEEYINNNIPMMYNILTIDNVIPLVDDLEIKSLYISNDIVGCDIPNSTITYTYKEDKVIETIDTAYRRGLIDLSIPHIERTDYTYEEYKELPISKKYNTIHFDYSCDKYSAISYIDYINEQIVVKKSMDTETIIFLDPLPDCEYSYTKRN